MNKFKSDFEKRTFKKLKKYGKIDYEGTTLQYVLVRNYLPDFCIRWLRNGIYQLSYLETKGYFSPEDRQKHKLVKQQHPDLDIRILFLADNKINRRSKTRYSDWCNQQGIPNALREIPKDWFTDGDTVVKNRQTKDASISPSSVGTE